MIKRSDTSERPEKPQRKRKLPLHTVLVSLLILTFVFTAVNFSRFSVSGTGSDSARAASFVFDVTEATTPDQDINFTDDKYSEGSRKETFETNVFTVSNTKDGKTSEAAVKYDIVVTLPKAERLLDVLTITVLVKNEATGLMEEAAGTTLTISDGIMEYDSANGESYVVSSDGKTYTLSNPAWVFPAGEADTRTYAVQFTVDGDVMLDSYYSSDVSFDNIKISVHAEQVD